MVLEYYSVEGCGGVLDSITFHYFTRPSLMETKLVRKQTALSFGYASQIVERRTPHRLFRTTSSPHLPIERLSLGYNGEAQTLRIVDIALGQFFR
jgi:hypothetical protein